MCQCGKKSKRILHYHLCWDFFSTHRLELLDDICSLNRSLRNYSDKILLIKILKACNFIKKRLQHRCFPVQFAKFLRTPYFIEHIRLLLLLYILTKHSVSLFFYSLLFCFVLKGTLIQIWKSPCTFLFIWKDYPQNFAFLILRILELYTSKVCVIFVYKHTETIEYVKK